jgi:tetratricopeptide (TPR) repeat protein
MEMMPIKRQSVKLILVLSLACSLFFSTLISAPAQTQSNLSAPAAHVSDNAGAMSEAARQQLENILGNLQARSGINFTVVMVRTTGGRDIYDFSSELARNWDIGSRNSASKSLLLVVSVEEKIFFTQFSQKVARQLPEGALGEMSQRLRGRINSGRVAEALVEGVQQFVGELGQKVGFSTDGLDQPAPAQTAATEAVATPVSPTNIEASPTDSRTPATPVEDPKPAKKSTRVAETSDTPTKPATNSRADAARNSGANSKKKNTPADDEAEAEEVEVTLSLPFATRVVKLKAFLAEHPDSKSKARATELLISAHAALGDEKLRAGDNAAGIEQLFLAISESPADISDKLFAGVISQIPLNLYLRGEQAQALRAAQLIEAKVAADPKRLDSLSGFYLRIERSDEAVRLAESAVKLAPDMAAAHHALGLAFHISLRLDEAAAEYKRALSLDSKTPAARRSLADLDRAAGKSAEALALYRDQLGIDSADKGARTGLVLSLYDLGQTAEADQEFAAAIKDDPRNLALITGAAYWFVAHNNSKRGLELAQQAADLEPRYTWGQIALARALVAEKQPLFAERSLRFVRQYGQFPTLDYELANTLATLGLYEEAGEALSRSFELKGGFIETRLAGRVPARAAGFLELLAPERQASIFQATPADSEINARALKGLLAFTQAINPPGDNAKIDEAGAIAAAQEFASANDEMRTYRQLYAASRLLQHGIGFQAAQALADGARDGVDAAILVPAVTVAVQADELREIRAQAIAGGGTPDIPEAPRNIVGNILRGRIEDLSGWALINQDKTTEAVAHLRRAVGVLPEQTPVWRSAVWHLGTALQQGGNNEEALGYYIKGYNAGFQDPVRRVTIEQLYKKVNGSLDGLDARIGPPLVVSNAAQPASSPAATTPLPEPTVTPTPETTPATQPAVTPSPESTPTPAPSPTPLPQATPQTPAPEPTPATDSRPRRVKPPAWQ